MAWQLSFRSTPTQYFGGNLYKPSFATGVLGMGRGPKLFNGIPMNDVVFFPLGGQSWLWYLWLWANLWWNFFRPIHMCKKSPCLGGFLIGDLVKVKWFIIAESCWNKALTKKRQKPMWVSCDLTNRLKCFWHLPFLKVVTFGLPCWSLFSYP